MFIKGSKHSPAPIRDPRELDQQKVEAGQRLMMNERIVGVFWLILIVTE